MYDQVVKGNCFNCSVFKEGNCKHFDALINSTNIILTEITTHGYEKDVQINIKCKHLKWNEK